MEFKVNGILPAMVTPLTDGGQRVNYSALGEVCDFLIERGVSGLFALGTTGEGTLLSEQERKQALEKIVDHVAGRVIVVANCGDITTQGTIGLMKHAAGAGADAVSAVFPYYYGLGVQDVKDHFLAAARSVPDLPVYLYYYRRALEPEETLEVKQAAPNVVGIKDGCGDYKSLVGHIVVMGESFSVLEGSEMLAYGALTLGADGLISGIAAAIPEPFVELHRLVQNGRYEEARAVQATIYRLARVIYGRNPWAFIKKVLVLRGVNVGPGRAPLGECTAEETDRLRAELVNQGLL